MKLYRVKLRGMRNNYSSTKYGDSYVVAHDPTEAYIIVRKYCNKADVGYYKDREMESVELLAEEGDYPDCQTQLHITQMRPDPNADIDKN